MYNRKLVEASPANRKRLLSKNSNSQDVSPGQGGLRSNPANKPSGFQITLASQQAVISPQKMLTKGTSFAMEKQSRISSGQSSQMIKVMSKRSINESKKGFNSRQVDYIKQNESSDSDLKDETGDMMKKKRGSVLLKAQMSPEFKFGESSNTTGDLKKYTSNTVMKLLSNKPSQPGGRGMSNTMESPMITHTKRFQNGSFSIGLKKTESSLTSTQLPSQRDRTTVTSKEPSAGQGLLTSRDRPVAASQIVRSSLPGLKLRNNA